MRTSHSRLMALLGSLMAVVVAILPSCRTSLPIDRKSDRIAARGTISGTLRGPDNRQAFGSRKIEAVNVLTGERHAGQTNDVGGYTFLLPPGTYRLEVALLAGEAIVSQPDPIDLKAGDIDADRDIVVAGAGIATPPKD